MTYDVTNQQSLLNIRGWLSDLDDMTQVVVVGNKCDLIKGNIMNTLKVKSNLIRSIINSKNVE